MKLLLLLLVGLSIINKISAQDINDYQHTDNIALSISQKQTSSTKDIADYIQANFKNEKEKVRAIYTWITNNITYSTDSMHLVILDEDHEQKITNSLRRKKGVCENYAAIFNDICLKSGLKSFVVEGYTKQNGSMDRTAHAWCTVLVENTWLLYDPTWDANFENSTVTGHVKDIWFQVPPSVFIETHMPFDPMFQLLNYPVTFKEFDNGKTGGNNTKSFFNYADSIAAYRTSNPLGQYLSASSRIENNGITRSLTKDRLNKLKMEMEIIYQGKDADLYNSALADYNNAIALFNSYLNYRNNQFMPSKTEAELKNIFDGIEGHIETANSTLKEINLSKANLTIPTDDVQMALNNLLARVKEQKIFLNNYLSTAK